MRKIIILLVFAVGALLPWACSDNNSPSKPNGPALGGPTNTPTIPIASTPGTPTNTPTPALPAPVYIGEFGIGAPPDSMYLASATTLYVSVNGKNPNIEIFDPTAFSNQPIGGANYVVTGVTPVTVLLAGPQGVAFTSFGGNNWFTILDVSPGGAATIYAGFDGSFPNAPEEQGNWGMNSLNAPQGFTSDSNGNIYVADTGSKYVDEFQIAGSPGPYTLHQWNGLAAHPFVKPVAVACDTSGNVYVGDSGYSPSLIQEFAGGGVSFINQWFTKPGCNLTNLSVDSTGEVFVCDTGNHLVEEYSNAGSLVRQWGSPTGSSYQLNVFAPTAVIHTATNTYVGDSGDQKIMVYGP